MTSDSTLPGIGDGDGAELAPAPEVLALAKVVAKLRVEVMALEGAASATAVVERATGVLMAREDVSAEEAYGTLLRRAIRRGRTLLEESRITLGQVPSRTVSPPQPPEQADPPPREALSAFGSGRYPAATGRSVGHWPVLARLADGLAGARSPDEIAELLRTVLGGAAGVDGVMIYAVAPAGGLRLAGHAGVGDGVAEQWRHVPPLSGVAALEAIGGGRALWLEDAERDAIRCHLIGDPPERWPTRAWLPVPGDRPATAAIGFLRTRQGPFDAGTRTLLRGAVRLCADSLRFIGRSDGPGTRGETEVVQRIFDVLSGTAVLLTPVRSPAGEVRDFRIDAAAPESVDVAGRRGKELVGRHVLETYPTIAGTALWEGYLDTLTTGTAYDGEPFVYQEVSAGVPRESTYSVRATRLGDRLVVSWIRHDSQDRETRRLEDMQRLANLGWAGWSLATNTITWSEQVYTVFGRDPALGPMTLEELPRHLVPEDVPVLGAAVERLLREGAAIDQPFRITTADGVRHLRFVAEAQTDADGAPVEVHGFFQDVTAQREAELALDESERAVLMERGMLQAERALAARLQNALLPIPEQSLELAGLRIDVAYLPSESGVNVGGDWYSAIGLPDERALFVVGDVAGHGLDAVATMAQLRFTIKGMVVTGSALPDVLHRLNTLLLHTASDKHAATATVIMGIYRPGDRRLTWVRAGHLPPLLIRGGAARFLPLPEGSLLGAAFESVYGQHSLDLEPGDHLVLYTDGLVEEPGEDIEVGLARLADTARRLLEEGRGEALARTLAARRRGHRDDICVLDIHVPG
ncbi:SpoIIE family protein phosphatase [Streptomyces sp. LARHCF249]